MGDVRLGIAQGQGSCLMSKLNQMNDSRFRLISRSDRCLFAGRDGGVYRLNFLWLRYAIFHDEIDQVAHLNGDFRGISNVHLTWMNRFIANHSARIQSLLYLDRQAFLNERCNICVDIFPFFPKMRHQFLDSQTQKCSRPPWRAGDYASRLHEIRDAIFRHVFMWHRCGCRVRINHISVNPNRQSIAMCATTLRKIVLRTSTSIGILRVNRKPLLASINAAIWAGKCFAQKTWWKKFHAQSFFDGHVIVRYATCATTCLS